MSDDTIPRASHSASDVSELVHDLRNSLYVFRLGLGMLAQMHGDDKRFDELLLKLQAEEQAATLRLEEFSRASRASE